MDVFPTPWSPRNTILYLARGEMLGVAEDCPLPFVGAAAVAMEETYGISLNDSRFAPQNHRR